MNILVTGANGQLGNCLRRAAAGSAHRYIFTDVADGDTVIALFQHFPETTLRQPFDIYQKSVAVPLQCFHGPAVL